jgi:error-prone DNA polymerase
MAKYTTNQTIRHTEWICHTNFSFLVGASHPNELLDQAASFGLSGLGVTDFDGAYGLARSYRHWKAMGQKGRPDLFYGAEIHLAPEHELPITLRNTLVLIAKSSCGYQNLCKILTHSHRNGKYNAFIPIEDLASHSLDDLIAIVPMRGLIRRNKQQIWSTQNTLLKDLFRENLYFVVSRHLSPAEDAWIPKQIDTAHSLDAKILLSQDIFFHCPSKKNLSDVLHSIRVNRTIDHSVEHMFVNDQRTFLSPQDFHKRYQSLPCYPSALRASEKLREQINFSFAELKYRYPSEMIPQGYTAQSYLEKITWDHALKTYPQDIPSQVRSLLERELQLIAHLKFADYFLTVWDIVSWARGQNILCQGRGSAANSAVCFVLGITAVNPSKFDVLFERFISVERGDPPDIDVDFENERREEVIQYIYGRYGKNRAAMVANVITYRRKGSLRDVGKVLGISDQTLSQASDLIGSRVHAGKSVPDILQLLDTKPSKTETSKINLWIKLAGELRGFPRHLGIHSGGFIISDRSLSELVPCEPAAMTGRFVIQWSKDDIEELGFFKIDLLALGMLTALRKMFALLKDHYHRQLTIETIPEDDPETYQMIQQADTIGTFQIESRAQMSMLPRMLPKTFYDLVIEVAIIRPGPIQGGMIHPFLRRRNGLEPITYPDKRLEPILHRTLGIPIFQEQVMRIAIAVGNFTPGEANELRKSMGAWTIRGDINPWLVKLAQGLRQNNIPDEFAETIVSQMKGFAEYGFPESHSVSFALIAYASSYLKCHYPAVFFVGILNSQPMGFYSPHTLIQTALRCGVKVLPVSITKSSWDCTLENITLEDPRDQRHALGIRLGFAMISGFSKNTASSIEASRAKHGAWTCWQDFLRQTALYARDLTQLAAAGALDPFGLDRRSAIWMASAAPHSPFLEDVEEKPKFKDETIFERVQQDFEMTGTSLYEHPVKILREHGWCFPIKTNKLKLAKDIASLLPNQTIYVFGIITVMQRPPSAKGMMFITLEDETGYSNLVLTPQTSQKFASILQRASMICIAGKLQKQGAAHSILVKEILAPEVSMAEIIPIAAQAPDAFSAEIQQAIGSHFFT